MFANDTNLYLGKNDHMDHVQTTLDSWCHASGAKFNTEKTEIIPIRSKAHREQVRVTWKINQDDQSPFHNQIKIANKGDAIRSLGTWIGNNINTKTPWKLIVDNVHKTLKVWGKSNPTLTGHKLIVQAIVSGHTQFLAKAQGMPPNVEDALTKLARNFIWEENTKPEITLDYLHCPIEEGGLNLLNIAAKNDTIEIMWLQAYLNFSPTCPIWAKVTDLIIDTSMPQGPNA